MFYHNAKNISESDYANSLSERKEHAGFDGFFETMACVSGQIPLQKFHLARLKRSVTSLGLEPELVKLFQSDLAQLDLPQKGVVKYQVLFDEDKKDIQRFIETRPPRTYPNSYWQEGVSILISSESLASHANPQGIKSIKRAMYERVTQEYTLGSCAEALLLNRYGEVIEGTKTNVFGIKNNCLITPALSDSGVAGVMRAFIVQLANKQGLSVRLETVTIDDLRSMDAVFMSNALIGLWPVHTLLESQTIIKQWGVVHPVIQTIKNNLPDGCVYA